MRRKLPTGAFFFFLCENVKVLSKNIRIISFLIDILDFTEKITIRNEEFIQYGMA